MHGLLGHPVQERRVCKTVGWLAAGKNSEFLHYHPRLIGSQLNFVLLRIAHIGVLRKVSYNK